MGKIKIYRVDKVWQLADVFSIRLQTKIHGEIPEKQVEFDENIDKKYYYLLIEDDELPIGTCRVNFDHDDYVKVERVSVIDAYQGRGIGRTLIKAAEQWALESGFTRVIITSLDTAIGFYRKLGYIQSGEIQIQDDGVPTIFTEKNLIKEKQT